MLWCTYEEDILLPVLRERLHTARGQQAGGGSVRPEHRTLMRSFLYRVSVAFASYWWR
jgi:hypothetical protein